jgi:hypothetical protein
MLLFPRRNNQNNQKANIKKPSFGPRHRIEKGPNDGYRL